jgi:predicted dehydrogenase
VSGIEAGPTKSKLRIVQVGAGMMGRAWLRTIGNSLDAELVGLVDLDVDQARRAADEVGRPDLPVAASLPALLERVDADVAVDVTVPAAHRQVSTGALRAGLPVLCEKPLAESVSSGLAMIAAAELSRRLLMVSQSRRYFRPLEAFRRQIAAITPVGLAQCSLFRAPRFGGFREQMAYPLLIDMAIHQFDLARDLIGDEPVAVQCESFNPSWSWYAGDAAAQVTVAFAGGARFSFTGSFCSPGQETSWNGHWRISGAGGTASWDGDGLPEARAADGTVILAEPGHGAEEIAGSLAEFVDAVQTGRTPSGEVHGNLLSLAMVEAAIRSAEEDRRVSIAEVLDDAYAEALVGETDPEIRAVLGGWRSVHEVVGVATPTALTRINQ